MLAGGSPFFYEPEVRGVASWFSYICLMFDSNWAVLGMSLMSFDFLVPPSMMLRLTKYQTEKDLTFGVFWGPFQIRKNG